LQRAKVELQDTQEALSQASADRDSMRGSRERLTSELEEEKRKKKDMDKEIKELREQVNQISFI
jgi:chromosome segregation ATPase